MDNVRRLLRPFFPDPVDVRERKVEGDSGRGFVLRWYRDPHENQVIVWIDVEPQAFGGLVIGMGDTEQAALDDAVAWLEAVEAALHAPPAPPLCFDSKPATLAHQGVEHGNQEGHESSDAGARRGRRISRIH